jgi:hypothetical protein
MNTTKRYHNGIMHAATSPPLSSRSNEALIAIRDGDAATIPKA